jgi:hypothetical protein
MESRVMRRSLRTIRKEQTGLGLSTIMDRQLAVTLGTKYVHLAVFAIDIDRVYWLEPERSDLPFGWEVFLCELEVLEQFDPESASDRELVAAMCANVLEAPPGEPALGGQIVFAIYDAVRRGQLDAELAALFMTWHRPPEDLVASLAKLWEAPAESAKRLAEHCLRASLTPPLAPPTLARLEALAKG